MKNFILLFLILTIDNALACYNDFDCGFGNSCVKPNGSINLTGSCITITNEYGYKDYNTDRNWGRGSTPQTVSSCQINADCPIGSKCMKESGELYGICLN